jgi:hypothetical protein
MSDDSSAFVVIQHILINIQTVCAASLVNLDELHLWFPGSSQTAGPSFRIKGPEAQELWAILKQSARTIIAHPQKMME